MKDLTKILGAVASLLLTLIGIGLIFQLEKLNNTLKSINQKLEQK
jgi:hypothetical protein